MAANNDHMEFYVVSLVRVRSRHQYKITNPPYLTMVKMTSERNQLVLEQLVLEQFLIHD